jgi:lysozyme family protein
VGDSIQAADRYSGEFLSAVARLLADEGGYSANPADPGGPTRFGISARAYPTVDIASLTRDEAIAIYWREWWQRYGFARLPAAIASKTFDLAVNIGAAHAIQCLQRALRACGIAIADDGVLGPATERAAARADAAALLAALRSEAAGYYRVTAVLARGRRAGADQEFLKGWLNRAYE